MRERSTGIHAYARWSFLFAAGGVVLVLLAVSSVRETYQGWKVNQEIRGLQAQVEALEGRRLHLADTLNQLQSPDTIDKQARLRQACKNRRTGLRLQSGSLLVPSLNGQFTAPSAEEAVVSNPRKWARYFFHPAFDDMKHLSFKLKPWILILITLVVFTVLAGAGSLVNALYWHPQDKPWVRTLVNTLPVPVARIRGTFVPYKDYLVQQDAARKFLTSEAST
jgi:cell division protein FtsB